MTIERIRCAFCRSENVEQQVEFFVPINTEPTKDDLADIFEGVKWMDTYWCPDCGKKTKDTGDSDREKESELEILRAENERLRKRIYADLEELLGDENERLREALRYYHYEWCYEFHTIGVCEIAECEKVRRMLGEGE